MKQQDPNRLNIPSSNNVMRSKYLSAHLYSSSKTDGLNSRTTYLGRSSVRWECTTRHSGHNTCNFPCSLHLAAQKKKNTESGSSPTLIPCTRPFIRSQQPSLISMVFMHLCCSQIHDIPLSHESYPLLVRKVCNNIYRTLRTVRSALQGILQLFASLLSLEFTHAYPSAYLTPRIKNARYDIVHNPFLISQVYLTHPFLMP